MQPTRLVVGVVQSSSVPTIFRRKQWWARRSARFPTLQNLRADPARRQGRGAVLAERLDDVAADRHLCTSWDRHTKAATPHLPCTMRARGCPWLSRSPCTVSGVVDHFGAHVAQIDLRSSFPAAGRGPFPPCIDVQQHHAAVYRDSLLGASASMTCTAGGRRAGRRRSSSFGDMGDRHFRARAAFGGGAML